MSGSSSPRAEAERVAPPPPGPRDRAAGADAQRPAARQRPYRDHGDAIARCRWSPPRWSPRGGSAADPQGRAGAAGAHRRGDDRGHARPARPSRDRPRGRGARLVARQRRRLGRRPARPHRAHRQCSTRALAIIADVARNAALADEELDRQRTDRDRRGRRRRCATRARLPASPRCARSTAPAPTAIPAGGTAASLRAITRADIERAYRRSVAGRTTRP